MTLQAAEVEKLTAENEGVQKREQEFEAEMKKAEGRFVELQVCNSL